MSSTDSSTTNTNCAACGIEGGTLNTCNKCKLVKYCNAACKRKHHSKHKKACEKRVAALHEEALFKEHPPNEDCPICFQPFPLYLCERTFSFHSCCGKIICNGCIYAMREEARGRGKIGLCAFCRKPNVHPSSEENVKRLKKLMEVNNAYAFNYLAGDYATGDHGMPQDWSKANELYLRAGELGCASGYFWLGHAYESSLGVEADMKKSKYFYELAAINGHVMARHHLGLMEGEADRAYKHFILAARAGYKESLDWVKNGFMIGLVTKDEYANTLRAYQQRHDAMKSDDRDKCEELYQSL